MVEYAYQGIIVILFCLVVFVLVLNQIDRRKSTEREMKLVKGIVANNVQELAASEASPKDIQKRMIIENDLATKAAKLLKAEEEGKGVPVQ